MTTRTVKMYGLAYGSSPAEITVTLDGATVYNGAVSTIDSPALSLPNLDLVDATVELCSFELPTPMEFEGTKPMTCVVTNGTVIFATISANYFLIAGTDPAVGTGPDVYPGINGAGDARSNVVIDGVAQPVNHEEFSSTWWFKISAGSTLAYDLNIQPGTEAVAPAEPATP